MKINDIEFNKVFFTLVLIISGLITIIFHEIFKINFIPIYWLLGSMSVAIGLTFK